MTIDLVEISNSLKNTKVNVGLSFLDGGNIFVRSLLIIIKSPLLVPNLCGMFLNQWSWIFALLIFLPTPLVPRTAIDTLTDKGWMVVFSGRFQQAKGLGYAMNTTEELNFVKEIAETTGVVLDPVYRFEVLYFAMNNLYLNSKLGLDMLFVN